MSERLKIISYNIHKGMSLYRKNIIKEIKETLKSQNSDIVFLQEVQGRSPSLTSAQFEFLADSIWHHYSYGKNAAYSDSDHGNAILSKFPIIDWSNKDISSSRFEKRGILYCKIITETGKSVNLFCLHLSLLRKDRISQVNSLIQTIKENIPEDEPLIIAGDFNEWSSRLDITLYHELGLKDAFYSLKNKSTFPSIFPILKLDKVFYKNIELVESRTLSGKPWSTLSDHLALFVEFKIK